MNRSHKSDQKSTCQYILKSGKNSGKKCGRVNCGYHRQVTDISLKSDEEQFRRAIVESINFEEEQFRRAIVESLRIDSEQKQYNYQEDCKLRDIQDAEYTESLLQDKLKEEEKERQREAEEKQREAEEKQWMDEKKILEQRFEYEPEGNDTILLIFKFPSRLRVTRRFSSSDSVQDLYDYIKFLDVIEQDYVELVIPYPRQVLEKNEELLSTKQLDNSLIIVDCSTPSNK